MSKQWPWDERQWPFNAYYFSFESTASEPIDTVLKAVAYAGKSYHHTDQWSNPDFVRESGPSCIELIEGAARDAADHIKRLEARVAELEARSEYVAKAVELMDAYREAVSKRSFKEAGLTSDVLLRHAYNGGKAP